jgi:uncharacterized membrane protein
MTTQRLQVTAHVENSPEAVIGYIADVRHRPLYLSMLKSVSDIEGDPSAVGTTWKWTWVALGMEFEGIGRCLRHEPGRLYALQSEGGLESTWTYRAEPEGEGTRLTLDVEYQIPEKALGIVPTGAAAEALRKTEADRAVKNLKTILDR